MATAKKKGARQPLARERVLRAALGIADQRGLEALTMREVALQLGVEAMSLYKHVANKDDMLDGLVELVISEMAVPRRELGWKAALRERAGSAREVLLRHGWAAMLIESRLTPGPARLRLHNATLGVLREAGFSVALAYKAYLTLDSYVYGFVMQEVWWPFEPEQRPVLIDQLAPAIAPADYPWLVEVMGHVASRSAGAKGRAAAYAREFKFGLELVLDGLEARSKK